MTAFRAVLLLILCSGSLGAQTVAVGYEIASTDQQDLREARGIGLRFQFRGGPVELRYDYLSNDGERFDYPCGGFIPPDCVQEDIHYSAKLHSLFVAARARLLSLGAVHLTALPELGFVNGNVEKRSVASGQVGASGSGAAVGAGIALELSVTRVGGALSGDGSRRGFAGLPTWVPRPKTRTSRCRH